MNFKTLKIFSSILGLAVTLMALAVPARAYTLTEDPNCAVAVGVFNPSYTDCKGAYLLEGGENDVTDGAADNIVNQLLNVDDVFGTSGGWTFLGKTDDSSTSPEFTLTGLNATTGTLEITGISLPAKIVVSFKAADSFSLYLWNPLNDPGLIEWATSGTATNRNGGVQGLSHASVYWMENGTVPPQQTPEPGTIVLMGSGLAGLGFWRWKKATKSQA